MGFMIFVANFPPFILYNDYAKPAAFSACWCRMEKLSAKCISCIGYTRAGNDSVKLPGMTELAEIQIACLAHLCRFACG
jgi:hypothetical protein